jgi:hypothetical protein
VAATLRALWCRRPASAAPPRAAGPTPPDRAAPRAADNRRGAGMADVGLWAPRGAPRPRVRDSRGRRDLPAAHRADPAATRSRPGPAEPARAGHPAWRTGLSRHLLYRQAQGSRQGLEITASDAACSMAWPGCCPRSRPRPARCSCARSWCRSTGAPDGRCSESSPMGAPSSKRLRRGLPRPGHPAHSDLAASRLDQRLCRTHVAQPRWLHAVLQRAAATPGRPPARSHACRTLHWRGSCGELMSSTCSGKTDVSTPFRVLTH